MQVEFRSLPIEILTTWNAEWPDGSSDISVWQLKKSLQIYVEKEMDTELQVVPYHLGLWLLKNGWAKIKPMKSRRWKKEQSTTNAEAKSPAKANLRTTQVAQKVPARHRPWYIDFKYDSLRLSKLTFTKNVIFEKRAESEPEVYWELRHLAKALNAVIENLNLDEAWYYSADPLHQGDPSGDGRFASDVAPLGNQLQKIYRTGSCQGHVDRSLAPGVVSGR